MKKMLCVGVCIVLALFSVQVFADGQVECIIIKHSTDIPKLKKEIKQKVSEGYIPEGITYDGNELYIMYMDEPGTVLNSWSLEIYEDSDELEAGLDKNGEAGFFPTGMTAYDGKIYVLFTEEEGLSISGYSFVNTSWETMEEDLQDDFDEGYIPVAVAASEEGDYYVLMVTIPDTEVEEWLVEEYEIGKHQDAIDEMVAEGYFPCGFEAGNEAVHVLYIKM